MTLDNRDIRQEIAEFEPELSGPYPRRVVSKRRSSRLEQVFSFVGFLPLLFLLCFTFGWTTTSGQITSKDCYDDDDTPPSLTCEAHFSYIVGDRPYDGVDTLTYHDYGRFFDGQPVTVRYMPLMPGAMPLLITGDDDKTEVVGLFWLPFLIVYIPALVWALIELARRRIYSHGIAVAARIVDKRVTEGLVGERYRLDYEFTRRSRSGDVPQAGNMYVDRETYDRIPIGDTVTALTLPNCPRLNTLYRFGPYRLAGAGSDHPLDHPSGSR
ncbi:MAG: hypothetical protein ACLQVD_20560 [Capsulimonadaceae bacterium]